MVLRGGVERTAGGGVDRIAGGSVCVARIELIAVCKVSVIKFWLNCIGGDMFVCTGENLGAYGAMKLVGGSRFRVYCTLGNMGGGE